MLTYFHNLFYVQVLLEWWIVIDNILKYIYFRNFRLSCILVQIWLCLTQISNHVSHVYVYIYMCIHSHMYTCIYVQTYTCLYKALHFSKGEKAKHIWIEIQYWATHYTRKSIMLFIFLFLLFYFILFLNFT